ncbi:MAG: Co2+/Mg2+ efflux protein ApaG [Myxococcales bacterium]|nr:Co2+/Mg2+ efflux protein ApaG [Myxococcales bacterium]
MSTSTATTSGIQIDVDCRFVAEESVPSEGRWFFAYQITISNLSERTVQLVSREWVITNADGKVETVRGPGVVGHQPVLRPNEGFQYVSGCPLDSAFGEMRGTYQMIREDGEPFEVSIAPFVLIDPQALN